jgi:beta-glucanase (GH16 family)
MTPLRSIATTLLATLMLTGLGVMPSVFAAFTQPEATCAPIQISQWQPHHIVSASAFNGDANAYPFVNEVGADSYAVEDGELRLKMRLGGKNEFGRDQGVQGLVSWTRKLQYGRISAKIKTAGTSPGVVSAFMVMSPEGDEIDFEWVGKNRHEVQTNYYYNTKADGPDYSNGRMTALPFDTTAEFHTYTIEWTPDWIAWYVDDQLIRKSHRRYTLRNGVYRFPTRAAKVSFNVWDGGMGPEGTAKWAGTPTDWSDPNRIYTLSIKDINFQCIA